MSKERILKKGDVVMINVEGIKGFCYFMLSDIYSERKYWSNCIIVTYTKKLFSPLDDFYHSSIT